MEIKGIQHYTKAYEATIKNTQASQTGRESKSASSVLSDRVEFSPEAAKKTELYEVDRKNRITALKQTIEAGSYKIDSAAIAAKMMDESW